MPVLGEGWVWNPVKFFNGSMFLSGDVAKKEKTETKKDKTGKLLLSCCSEVMKVCVVSFYMGKLI